MLTIFWLLITMDIVYLSNSNIYHNRLNIVLVFHINETVGLIGELYYSIRSS